MTPPAKILVVDDNESARATVERLLGVDGYHLAFAADAAEAIAELDDFDADLVLSEVLTPRIDGLELCRALRAHPDRRFVPVILVSALDAPDDLVRGLDAGADDFLSKPVDRMVLRARVRAMLRVRRNYGELRSRANDLGRLVRIRIEQLATAAQLSAREREVLGLLLEGRSHEDIGVLAGMTARTSKFHQANILQKLGAESRLDLLRLFF